MDAGRKILIAIYTTFSFGLIIFVENMYGPKIFDEKQLVLPSGFSPKPMATWLIILFVVILFIIVLAWLLIIKIKGLITALVPAFLFFSALGMSYIIFIKGSPLHWVPWGIFFVLIIMAMTLSTEPVGAIGKVFRERGSRLTLNPASLNSWIDQLQTQIHWTFIITSFLVGMVNFFVKLRTNEIYGSSVSQLILIQNMIILLVAFVGIFIIVYNMYRIIDKLRLLQINYNLYE